MLFLRKDRRPLDTEVSRQKSEVRSQRPEFAAALPSSHKSRAKGINVETRKRRPGGPGRRLESNAWVLRSALIQWQDGLIHLQQAQVAGGAVDGADLGACPGAVGSLAGLEV